MRPRAVEFLGFGYHPRSGFAHIELVPARSWGAKFSLRAVPFAKGVLSEREKLSESRVLRGAGITGVAKVGVVGIEMARQVLAEAQAGVPPLVAQLEGLRWVFLGWAMTGIAAPVWLRSARSYSTPDALLPCSATAACVARTRG